MEKFQEEIVKKMKQRVRTPQFLNRVINVYDFTTLFSRLMMYRRAKSSLVQPKKEGEEETMYNMYNSMFIRIKKKNKFNDKKMARILKRFYNISPTSTVEVMHTCMEYLSSLDGTSLGTTTATAARLPEHENLFTSHKNEFLVKRIFYLDKVTGRRVGVQSLCILNENTWLSSNQVQQINNLLLSNFISRL